MKTYKVSTSFQAYLNDIGRIPLLSREEEGVLAKNIREGVRVDESVEKLVHANLRFSVSVAKRYIRPEFSIEDLVQEGNTGLVKATANFDERLGFKFISYAVWYIRREIQAYCFDNTGVVKIPINQLTTHQRINKSLDTLCFSREHELIYHLKKAGLNKFEINAYLQIRAGEVSLDYESEEEECSGELINTLGIEDTTFQQQNDTKDMLALLDMTGLPLRERNIIVWYYGLEDNEPQTLQAIGNHINLTRERVRQLRNRSLGRMKQTILDEERDVEQLILTGT